MKVGITKIYLLGIAVDIDTVSVESPSVDHLLDSSLGSLIDEFQGITAGTDQPDNCELFLTSQKSWCSISFLAINRDTPKRRTGFERTHLNLSFDSPTSMKEIATKLRRWNQEYTISRSHFFEQPSEQLSSLEEQLFSWVPTRYHWENVADMHKSYRGKGIVVCASDKHIVLALSLIESVRTIHKCDLPIEVFYNGDDDLSKSNRILLEDFFDVKTKDISLIFDMNQLNIWGFAIKPFALLASSFRIAMLVDADVTFLQSPITLFGSQIFKAHGAMFFKDRTLPQEPYMKEVIAAMAKNLFLDGITQEPNKIVSGESQHMQESGVVLIDKKERIAGLLAACLLNLGSIRETTYKNMYGDKETFWIGFEMSHERYAFSPSNPGSISDKAYSDENGKVCSIQLLHVDERSQPLWINGGLYRNKNMDDYRLVSPTYWAMEPGTWDFSIGHMACLIPTSSHNVNTLSSSLQSIVSRTTEIFAKHQDMVKEITKLPSKLSKWSYDNIACENSVFDYQNSLDKVRFDHVARSISDYEALKHHRALESFKKFDTVAPNFSQGTRGILFCFTESSSESENLLTALQKARSVTQLPIEVWCSNYGCLNSHPNSLNALNVAVSSSSVSLSGAILDSSLDEILVMDLSSKPLSKSPEYFDLEYFQDTGLIFWKSQFKTRPDSPIWRILNMVCVDEFIPTSNQLVIRKSGPNMLESIRVARYMEENDPFGTILSSPADMLRFAARSVGAPFHFLA